MGLGKQTSHSPQYYQSFKYGGSPGDERDEEKRSHYKFNHVPKAEKTEGEKIAEWERDLGGCITEDSLSGEQSAVFDSVCHWYEKKDSDLLTLGGYAGTGKSTLVSVLANKYLEEKVAFCAFTGKATSVLRKKFYEANIPRGAHDISTLHNLLYYPIPNKETGGVSGWKMREIDYDLIVVDEASMLNKDLFADLQSHKIPILAVGDHGQLPPVFGNFSLMDNPHLRLEKIHRQAENSPILALSEAIRRTGVIPPMQNTVEVQLLEKKQIRNVVDSLFTHPSIRYDDVAMLCYRNETRVGLNMMARAARGLPYAHPAVGDQLICLKNTERRIFNGMRGTLRELNQLTDFVYGGRVLFEDDEIEVEGLISNPQFGRPSTFKDFEEYEQVTGYRPKEWWQIGLLMDFGYALTCHKAQGSSFEHVIALMERPNRISLDDWRRWAYTCVTRCSKYLVVLQ
jgi:exodeoxyribonuclease-5